MAHSATKSDLHKVPHHNLYGILFMLLNAASLALLYAMMKEITKDLSSHQAVFLYKFSLLLILLPWIFRKGMKSIYTKKLHLHVLRGFFSIAGSLSLMYALKHIEIIDVTALGYLEQVLLIIIGIVYFKEGVSTAKVVAITLSFIGALFILYPDLSTFNQGKYVPDLLVTKDFKDMNYYHLFVFLSVILWASNCIVIKLLSKTEKSKTQLFYVMFFASLFSYPVAFMKWGYMESIGLYLPNEIISFSESGIESKHLGYLAVVAACYFTHSIAFFKALSYADLSTVVPFDYSRLVFTGVLGFYLFGEEPLYGDYVGYVLIMVSGIYLARSEAVKRRKQMKKLREIEAAEHA
ncbi:MAG: DMT family transporter [Proteobacteria bacterium]|nr:DMT family transporter [Pseudomonadota bacterium]